MNPSGDHILKVETVIYYAGPWAMQKLHLLCCFRGCTLLRRVYLLFCIL